MLYNILLIFYSTILYNYFIYILGNAFIILLIHKQNDNLVRTFFYSSEQKYY